MICLYVLKRYMIYDIWILITLICDKWWMIYDIRILIYDKCEWYMMYDACVNIYIYVYVYVLCVCHYTWIWTRQMFNKSMQLLNLLKDYVWKMVIHVNRLTYVFRLWCPEGPLQVMAWLWHYGRPCSNFTTPSSVGVGLAISHALIRTKCDSNHLCYFVHNFWISWWRWSKNYAYII